MAMTHAGVAGPSSRGALFDGAGAPMIVFIWAIFAALTAWGGFPGALDQLSTDDAMRLAEVQDLLAGQSWFDLTQHRLNPPDGIVMHWSRVVDLPIAAILWTLQRVLAPDLALKLTLTVWPLLLLLPTLFAAASASRTLAGPAAGVLGAFMMVMSPGVTTRFAPSAIDHHGAQIALALTLLACAMTLDRSRLAAVGAGLAAALMMAIGMETAPHVAAAAAFVALRWAATGDEGMARGARDFGLSFAGFTALVAVTTLSVDSWTAPVCDTLGLGHIVVAALGGIGLAGAAHLVRGGVLVRFAALAQVGVAVAAGLLMAAPNCISSPYGFLPETLRTGWLDRVQEAHNVVASAMDEPTSAFAIGLPLLALIAVSVWALKTARPETFWRVATAVAMFVAALGVTAWQIRGASLAFALGGPLLPMAVLAVARTGEDRIRGFLALAALSPAALALAGLGLAALVGLPPIDQQNASKMCPVADYRAFGKLAPGLALDTIDVGPSIIAFTPHGAVAAPYHRNVDGLMAELEAFQGSDETARAIALSRRAAYVVVCPTDGGVRADAAAFPGGFSAKLMSKQPPAWLDPVDIGADARLKVFRVVAGR